MKNRKELSLINQGPFKLTRNMAVFMFLSQKFLLSF